MTQPIRLDDDQQAMLDGRQGVARQMAMRLVLDLAAAAGATELQPIASAHLSGVSPLTGGLGLRQFLNRLVRDESATVAVPTTLNAAGCDAGRFAEMRIVAPNFLEHSEEIIGYYEQLGVQPIQSCIPYEWEGVTTRGHAAWSESNAICFGNSYCGLLTNRDSGLSALASALTGYTPRYGLLLEEARRPNVHVTVTAAMDDPTDFSILGDWIGMQARGWSLPYGPIPFIEGLPENINHEQKKALAAAAANYGCPLLYLSDDHPQPQFQGRLVFDEEALAARYQALRPQQPVSLIVLGCPQASVGELRAIAALLKDRRVRKDPITNDEPPPLWVFTSSANYAIAQQTGLAQIIEQSGALLLENTCPEVVPYDQSWVHHILTNSMKAEHYIKSGLNGIPTAVMRLAECVALATGDWGLETGDWRLETEQVSQSPITQSPISQSPISQSPSLQSPSLQSPITNFTGHGLPSQSDYTITGEAFVTERPITFLGFVNRRTGVVEEPGHPAHGQSMAGKIAIFPKGTGSTVAPYVLLELYYRGMAPIAIVNTDIDQQSAPACSLENIPYAYDFEDDIIHRVNNGDRVTLKRRGDRVKLEILPRSP